MRTYSLSVHKLLAVMRCSRRDCAYGTPERPPRIHPVRIELLSARRRFREPVEIADVLPGLFDDPGTVVVFGSLMCCDNCAWVERFDFVERRDPFPSLLRIRLGEV